MLKNILLIIAAVLLFALSFFTIWLIMIFSAFGAFDKDYSITDLKVSYEEHQSALYELQHFYNQIVPAGKFVEIEFEDDYTLNRFGIMELDSLHQKASKSIYLGWHLDIDSHLTDSLIGSLGWTQETLAELKAKLDAADCIQIENGEPTRIGFQRSGMGMYSFNLFSKPLTQDMREKYNDSCLYILVNEKLALEYGGGAIGSQCFYNFE